MNSVSAVVSQASIVRAAVRLDQEPVRILFYSHDTYGLGHVRRTLCIAHALLRRTDRIRILIATGSPVIDRLSIDPRIQILQLKPVVKRGAELYEARDGSMDPKAVIAFRSAQLLGAVRFFRPDVVVVDHAPTGMKGELLAALQYIRREMPHTKTMLGLRDIVDDAAVVRKIWSNDHVYEVLDELYDRILVYGERSHFPLDLAYGLPPRVCSKLVYAGYIRKDDELVPENVVRSDLRIPPSGPFLLATVGGGGDGIALLAKTIAALPSVRQKHPTLRAALVTGPLMSQAEREAIERAAAFAGGVHVTSFFANMTSAMRAASVTVAMGGYNTVTELLAVGRSSVIVPRTHPRKEQLIRARNLSRRGLLTMVDPEPSIDVGALAAAIERCLAPTVAVPAAERIELCGTDRAVANILDLAGRRLEPSVPGGDRRSAWSEQMPRASEGR
jgi:predicted glycosyltransferase